MSLKMQKTLILERPMPNMGLADLIGLIERNNEALQRAYENIWSEVRYHEWSYYTRKKRLWRIGPVGDDFEVQYFVGTNIQDKSQWTNDANWEMSLRGYGGADV